MRTGRGTVAPRIACLVFGALIGLLLALVGSSPAQAHDEDSIGALVDQARWDAGLNGLNRNPQMDAVALGWAHQLAANGTLSHNPSYSSQIPAGWSSAAENVAQGYPTARAVHDGWVSSPGHRANILGGFTDIGIALLDEGGSTWAVEVFAAYPGSVGPAAPADPAPAPAAPVAPAPAAPAPADQDPVTARSMPATPSRSPSAGGPSPATATGAPTRPPTGSPPSPAARARQPPEVDRTRGDGDAASVLAIEGPLLAGLLVGAPVLLTGAAALLLPGPRRWFHRRVRTIASFRDRANHGFDQR